MTLSTVISSFHSSNGEIELLSQEDILASIADISNKLNTSATSKTLENEKKFCELKIAIALNTSTSIVHIDSYNELNRKFLSRISEREQSARCVSVNQIFSSDSFSALHETLFSSEFAHWLGIFALVPMAAFLAQISLLGMPLGADIPALLRYGGFIVALGIGLYAVYFIFQQGRIQGLSLLQKTLLYTAGFLLLYESWILISIVYSRVQ